MQEATFDPELAIDTALANKTDAEKKQWQRLQDDERAKLTVGDGNVVHGLRAINIAEAALQVLPLDDIKAINFEYTRMAEGYFLLGDFQRAYDTTRDETKRREYGEMLHASRTVCKCPAIRSGPLTLSPRFVIQRFPGKEVTRCTTCRSLSVTNIS